MTPAADFAGLPEVFCEQTKNDGVEAAGSENSDRKSETGLRDFRGWMLLNRNVRHHLRTRFPSKIHDRIPEMTGKGCSSIVKERRSGQAGIWKSMRDRECGWM